MADGAAACLQVFFFFIIRCQMLPMIFRDAAAAAAVDAADFTIFLRKD